MRGQHYDSYRQNYYDSYSSGSRQYTASSHSNFNMHYQQSVHNTKPYGSGVISRGRGNSLYKTKFGSQHQYNKYVPSNSFDKKLNDVSQETTAEDNSNIDIINHNNNNNLELQQTDTASTSKQAISSRGKYTLAKREYVDSEQDLQVKDKITLGAKLVENRNSSSPSSLNQFEHTNLEAEWPTLGASGQLVTTKSALKSLSKASQGSPAHTANLLSSSLLRINLPTSPIKLITHTGHFIEENVELNSFLQDSNSAFTVVSAVGLHGVGKSSILNSLLNDLIPGLNLSCLNFLTQNVDQVADNVAQTEGIDLQVSRERLFLLDTEPLLALESAESLIRIAASERRAGLGSAQPEFITVETGASIHTLQLCSFLMSVSHILLVVIDNWCDYDLLRHLELSDMLRPAVLEQTDFQPRVIVVFNKCSSVSMSLPAVRHELCQTLSALFLNTQFRFNTEDIYTLPFVDPSSLDSINDFKRSVKLLRKRILTNTRHHMLPKNLFNEKVWHQFAGQVWDSVQKSVMLAEYHRLIG